MPLHISEISVRIAIGDESAALPPPEGPRAAPEDPLTPERVEALVRACVHDTLRTLRMQEDR